MALLVLTIGIVGLVALFPTAIDATRESIEDTTAAIIAQSVHNALVTAFRSADPEITNASPITFYHDGLPNGVYTFNRPLTAGAQVLVPNPFGATDPERGTDATRTVFLCANRLGNSQLSYIRNSMLNISEVDDGVTPPELPASERLESDPTEKLEQYSFCIVVRRESPVEARLFYVRVDVFRNYGLVADPAPGWPLDRNSGLWLPTAPYNLPMAHPALVKSFSFYLCGP
jgi:hypothetical protein